MTSTKNIYQKLQELRVILQQKNLKKSGQNKYAGYKYYELHDFIPTVNELMLEMKLTSCTSYGTKLAKLEIINLENTTEIVKFTTPMSSASLKGCHEVQNLGAVRTYLRRYLWTTALEITESDPLESQTGNNEPDISDMTKKAISSATTTEALDGIEKRVKSSKKLDKDKDEILKLIADKKEFFDE